jgi:hypothetical protein
MSELTGESVREISDCFVRHAQARSKLPSSVFTFAIWILEHNLPGFPGLPRRFGKAR